jgi:insulysin
MQHILKSPNDKRNYYTYNLPNDLRVFIITDDNIDIASAAMLVKIGYYYDTIPGIAHFLEHMLFTGTKKFPEENHFSSFIAKHNGTHNAYTTHDHTCYYFSVAEEGFSSALENFGDFFVSPILNKNTINREKEAVHSEHIKNINDDSWRAHEIIKVAGTDNHPFKKFGTGSNETLNINNIDQIVRDFFEKYYSSNKMTLIVIISEKMMGEIKTLINQIFSQITIKNCNDDMISILTKEKILNPPKIIKYIPIENQDHLVLTWEIPFYKDSPTQSPLEFLFYLISNESKNSIHYILSRAGYIIGFYCHVREIVYNKCLFCIDIKLSPFGQNNKKQIIATVMEYINLLGRSANDPVLEKLYYDQLKLSVYKFKNYEKTNSLDTVLEICSLINDYNIDPKYINVISILQDDYSDQIKENMKEIIDCMTTDNLVIISGSNTYKDIDMNVFPNYGTKYSVENKKINYKNTLKVPSLPSQNSFISVNSNILEFDVKQPILSNNNKITSYWWPYSKFNTPDICLIVKFDLQISVRHVYLNTCMLLYLNSILTEINSDVYLCKAALYNFSLSYDTGSVYLKLIGNYGKFFDVLNYLLSAITNPTIITDESFETAKYSFVSMDDNSVCDAPYEKVTNIFAKTTSKYYYNENDRSKILKNITKTNVIDVFNRLFPFKKILLYTSGNCSKEMSVNINSLFESLMKDESTSYKNIDLYKIPQTSKIYEIVNVNQTEENVAVGFYVYLDCFDFTTSNNWAKNICL